MNLYLKKNLITGRHALTYGRCFHPTTLEMHDDLCQEKFLRDSLDLHLDDGTSSLAEKAKDSRA